MFSWHFLYIKLKRDLAPVSFAGMHNRTGDCNHIGQSPATRGKCRTLKVLAGLFKHIYMF
jgi:hypothetical protein